LLDADEPTFDRVYAVNVKSIYRMVQAVVPKTRDNGGVILNVGTVAGIRNCPSMAAGRSSRHLWPCIVHK